MSGLVVAIMIPLTIMAWSFTLWATALFCTGILLLAIACLPASEKTSWYNG